MTTDKRIRRLTLVVLSFMMLFSLIAIFDYDHITKDETSNCVKCEMIVNLLENLLNISKYFIHICVLFYVLQLIIKKVLKRKYSCTPIILKVQFNE